LRKIKLGGNKLTHQNYQGSGYHLVQSEEYKRMAMAQAHNPQAYWTLCGKAHECMAHAFYAMANECGAANMSPMEPTAYPYA
jgi:hypothetical protein